MTYKFKLSRRLAVAHLATGLTALLAAACGGDAAERLAPEQPAAEAPLSAVVISPEHATTDIGQPTRFTVYGRTTAGDSLALDGIEWSASGGSITADGLFSASAPGTYDLVAQGRGRYRDTSRVIVRPPSSTLTAIVVEPATATVAASAKQTFTATGKYSNGTSAPASVTWTATGGTVDAAGTYTAGATPGTYRVIATQLRGTLADTSVVTIPASAPSPTLAAVVLTPESATLATGATQQFSASGRLSDGSSTAVVVTWSATGGTVSSGGLYTAGSAAGTYRVIAKQQSGTLADTSVVTVTAAAPPPPPPPPPPPSGGVTYPNQPSGFTRIMENGFNGSPVASTSIAGEWGNPGGSNYSYTSASDAPSGQTGVLQALFPKGLAGGSSPGHFNAWNSLSYSSAVRRQEIYVSTRIKILGTNFENQAVGTKLWYVDYGNQNQQNDAYVMLHNGTGAQAVQDKMMLVMYVSPTADEEGGSYPFYQNTGSSKRITVGQWHHVEIYLNAGSVNQANGVVKIWIDGELVTNRTDVKFLDSDYGFSQGFMGWQWAPVWGGNGGTRTRDDRMQVDHIYASGR